jgi:hypothetical protein
MKVHKQSRWVKSAPLFFHGLLFCPWLLKGFDRMMDGKAGTGIENDHFFVSAV